MSAIVASVHVQGKGTGPMVLDHLWRVGDLVCFTKDGKEYEVKSVSWNHYHPRNHDCHIELSDPKTPLSTATASRKEK